MVLPGQGMVMYSFGTHSNTEQRSRSQSKASARLWRLWIPGRRVQTISPFSRTGRALEGFWTGWVGGERVGSDKGCAFRKINLAAVCLMESGVGSLGERETTRREPSLDFWIQLHVYSFKIKRKSSPDSVGEDQCGERMKRRHHSLLTPDSHLQGW